MVRALALPIGLLLAAAAGAAFLVEHNASAAVEVALPAATPAAPPQTRPAPADPVFRKGRLNLTPAQVDAVGESGLWPVGTRSLLDIAAPLTYGDFTWDDEAVPPGQLTVRVDLRTQIISVFRGGHEIGTAVILYGADSHRTPEGTYPIMARMRDHVSSIYDAPMPFTLRLTGDGVAIHGSDVQVGAATHGCIGVPIAFARRLFDEARVGDEVLIVRSPPAEPEGPAPLA